MTSPVEAVAAVLLRQYRSEYDADHLSWRDFEDPAREALAALPAEEQQLAAIITGSVAGNRWSELTPLDIARHLLANGIRIAVEVDNGGAS